MSQSQWGAEQSSVQVNGHSLAVSQLVAIAESLELERPDLFGFLKCFESSPDEMKRTFRLMIRNDYDNFAREVSCTPSAPPPPPYDGKVDMTEKSPSESAPLDFEDIPECIRSKSLQEAWELTQRLDEEEAARQHAEVESLARKLAEEDMKEELRRALFYCEICMDKEANIHGAITLDCEHRFCEECLSGFICNKIENHEVGEDELMCPRVGCEFPISHATIRGCSEGVGKYDIYEKFLNFTTDQYLESSIKAGAALRCPNSTCNFVFQWRPNGSSFPFKCSKCSGEYCLNCSLVSDDAGDIGCFGPGHAPLTCDQQLEKMKMQEEERLKFEEWKILNANANKLFNEMVESSGWKSCPNCKSVIERTEGCDHMTCKFCKCNFCFVCGKYNGNNPQSRGDCGTTCPTRR